MKVNITGYKLKIGLYSNGANIIKSVEVSKKIRFLAFFYDGFMVFCKYYWHLQYGC